jgi:hypothetical protein
MGFLVSLFAGPFAGIFGSLISSGVSYFEKKQKMEERQMDYAQEITLQKMNIEARSQELESEAAIAHTAAVASGLRASYKHDASYGPVGQTAATVLRFVRPALTFMLLGLTAAVYFTMPDGQIVGEDGVVSSIGELVVLKILFLGETATVWWFLDRRRSNK